MILRLIGGGLAFSVVALVALKALNRMRDSRFVEPAGKVVGIVGRMGSGKSYLAVRLAQERLRRGIDVHSNFTMKPKPEWGGVWYPFTGWGQFADISDAVVIIDEAHLYAPSYKHQQFPDVARQALAFARKRGLDVYWISQNEDRVNRTLRDLTNFIGVCSRGFRGRFIVRWYLPEEVRRKGEHYDKLSYRYDESIGALYDTTEIVDFDDHLVAAVKKKAPPKGEGRFG